MASSGAASASDAPAAGESDAPGEASLLVSEFPPPPYYFRQAKNLTPPPIPHEALERGTAQAAAAAARARAESERLRLGDEAADKTDAILGGVSAVEDEQDGAVVAVFGEIVEDPFLVEPLDRCQDPAVVKDRVKELNQEILQGFVKLVQDLVNRPMDNKYVHCIPFHCLAWMLLSRALNTLHALTCAFCYTFLQENSRRPLSQYIFNAARVQQVSRASSPGAVD